MTNPITFLIYKPLYNFLVLMTKTTGNLGFSIIILTVITRILLYPIFKKSFISQLKVKKLQPEIDKIKKEFPDKQLQGVKTMELYKEKGVNPFSGCLPMIIQLIVLFVLYRIFFKGFEQQAHYLYKSLNLNFDYSSTFLGIPLVSKSILLAAITAITQYFQLKFSHKYHTKNNPPVKNEKETSSDPKSFMQSFGGDFAENFQKQSMYIFPIMAAVLSYQSVVLALYWITSSVCTIIQEFLIHRSYKNNE